MQQKSDSADHVGHNDNTITHLCSSASLSLCEPCSIICLAEFSTVVISRSVDRRMRFFRGTRAGSGGGTLGAGPGVAPGGAREPCAGERYVPGVPGPTPGTGVVGRLLPFPLLATYPTARCIASWMRPVVFAVTVTACPEILCTRLTRPRVCSEKTRGSGLGLLCAM